MKSLKTIAYARSGDKGCNANIGVIAYDQAGYEYLMKHLTEQVVYNYFAPLKLKKVIRYELPNLLAFNFVLIGVLGEGGSRSLRLDPQGKALGQILLQMQMEIPDEILSN